jgi:hypothetical protein
MDCQIRHHLWGWSDAGLDSSEEVPYRHTEDVRKVDKALRQEPAAPVFDLDDEIARDAGLEGERLLR